MVFTATLVIAVLACAILLMVSVVIGLGFSRFARDSGREDAAGALAGWGVYMGAAVVAGGAMFGLGCLVEHLKHNPLDATRLLMLVAVMALPAIVAGLIAARIMAKQSGYEKSSKELDDDRKTIYFLGAAAAVTLIAWLTMPGSPPEDEQDERGKPLFASFDPTAVADLSIIQYNEKKAAARRLEIVRKDDGKKTRWVIPSHHDYPTDVVLPSSRKNASDDLQAMNDANDPTRNKTTQLAEAVAALSGLKILKLESNNASDHATYGVVDPDPGTRKEGASMAGAGMKVVLKDSAGKNLVALIIGKKIARSPDEISSDKSQPELHYVRRIVDDAAQDAVFVVDVKTDKLTTKFESWIETNLLKLNTMDIDQVQLLDYSIKEDLNMHSLMTLSYNDTGETKWKAVEDMIFKDGKPVNVKMAEDEELSVVKLDDMKRAFGDLKIVDVQRKPPGLSADLKNVGSVLPKQESGLSLQDRGFFLVRSGQNYSLYSTEGEVHCRMKDGLDYVIYFGKIASDIADNSDDDPAAKSDDADKSKDSKDAKDKKESGNRNRYLFVMAEFDPDAIPTPKLEDVPPEEETAADAKPADEKSADEKSADEKSGENPAAKEGEKAKGDDKKEKTEKSAAQLKREKIIKDNQRKQDEYKEKLEKGQKHVKELNARFADWYYVISNDVYNKIHLSRGDIVVKKEKPKEKGKDGEDKFGGHTDDETPADNPLREFERIKDQGLDAPPATKDAKDAKNSEPVKQPQDAPEIPKEDAAKEQQPKDAAPEIP
jgi:hypothetical protein